MSAFDEAKVSNNCYKSNSERGIKDSVPLKNIVYKDLFDTGQGKEDFIAIIWILISGKQYFLLSKLAKVERNMNLILTISVAQVLLRISAGKSIIQQQEPGLDLQADHRKLRQARISAIKQEILTKLGMSDVPKVRNTSITVQEQREKIQLFKKSLEDTYGQVHDLFPQQDFMAKKFHSFHASSKFPQIFSSYYTCTNLV